MATLVLSSVGTALGGPLGGAIGALIGESLDHALLAPARRGPRLGDLSVQTSTYGTQIPRVYGTMRVAGSVIWATDLVEHRNTTGGKGQRQVTYTYTVSMAVALSSRPATRLGRIWADGNLLRGAAGDLKVGGSLRFYEGSDDQGIDPLIGSVEGIANTPAFRGVALAVFEDLELASFGNRIPFMTFELIGDDQPTSVGSIIEDASAGAATCSADQPLVGYAAYGRSITDAVQPLADCFGLAFFDDGEAIRSALTSVPVAIGEDELGSSADGKPVPRAEREQTAAASLPAALRLSFYDRSRDYQSGEVRAIFGEQPGAEVQHDLPGVLSASDAKALAQQILARRWLQREKLTVRLPPARLGLEPGTTIQLPRHSADWAIEKAVADGFSLVAECRRRPEADFGLSGDGGRAVAPVDVVTGPISLVLFDVPNFISPANEPSVLLAASGSTAGWKARPVEVVAGTYSTSVTTAATKSVLGRAQNALPDASSDLLDSQNFVDVELIDPEQWLTSCDDAGLAAGQNLAVLGSELIQFGEATPLGVAGRFRLRRLLRGRAGTEWASGVHISGEYFCLLAEGGLQPVPLPTWTIGAQVSGSGSGGMAEMTDFTGEGVRPLSPIELSAERLASGDLKVNWTRRSRLGFAWVDGVDAPIGELREQYRIVLSGTLATLEREPSEPSLLVGASDVASLGIGAALIEVSQVGDFAASRPARLNINLI